MEKFVDLLCNYFHHLRSMNEMNLTERESFKNDCVWKYLSNT